MLLKLHSGYNLVLQWLVLVPGRIVNGSHNGLDLVILVKGFQSIIPSEAAHLVSSVGAIHIKRNVTIDPDDAGTDRSRDGVRHVQVLGYNPSCQAISCVICPLDSLFHGSEMTNKFSNMFHLTNRREKRKLKTYLNFINDITGPKISSLAMIMSSCAQVFGSH